MRAYLYLLAFDVGAGAQAIELAAARLLDPWFGNSQIVWTALISLILACLALGAWMGGGCSPDIFHGAARRGHALGRADCPVLG